MMLLAVHQQARHLPSIEDNHKESLLGSIFERTLEVLLPAGEPSQTEMSDAEFSQRRTGRKVERCN